MDSRISGLELCVSKWNRTVHYFFRCENKENFILMYSRISGLELCVSIRCENFRLEY